MATNLYTLIIGLGNTGQALVNFFQNNYPDQNLLIYDSREKSALTSLDISSLNTHNLNTPNLTPNNLTPNNLTPNNLTSNNLKSNLRYFNGQHGLALICEFINDNKNNLNKNTQNIITQIILSPGISNSDKSINQLINLYKKHSTNLNIPIKISSEIDIFLKHTNTPIIAITGTNGKSSVCKWMCDLLNICGKKVLLGGNYGPPAISLLNNKNLNLDYIILELSSFQLQQTQNFKAHIGCILNLTPDHLDMHKSFAQYRQAKLKIWQN